MNLPVPNHLEVLVRVPDEIQILTRRLVGTVAAFFFFFSVGGQVVTFLFVKILEVLRIQRTCHVGLVRRNRLVKRVPVKALEERVVLDFGRAAVASQPAILIDIK